MEHAKALLIKIVAAGILGTVILLTMEDIIIGPPLVTLLLAAIISYLLVDLFILPVSNNTVATAIDIVIWWSAGTLVIGDHMPIWLTGIVAPIIIGIGEWHFHKYMLNVVRRQTNRSTAD